MIDMLEASVVRITTVNNAVVGSGCFLGKRRVLTCAHVVSSALRIPEDTQTVPTGAVYLNFPCIAPGRQFAAHVIVWLPPRPDGGDDVAVLEMESMPPSNVQATQLVAIEDLWEHLYTVFGFPRGQEAGVFTTGRILGRQATGWIQIEDVKETGFPIEPGFSGAPVWDDRLKAVVGIVVASERREQIKAAFLIPIDVLINCYPAIRELIRPVVFIVASPQDRDYVAQLSIDLQKRGVIAWHDRLDSFTKSPDRQEAIRTAIRTAQYVLLVATPHARTSYAVKDNLRVVDMYQRHLLVLWVEGDEPMDAMPGLPSQTRWLNIRGMRNIDDILQNIRDSNDLGPSLSPLDTPRNPYKGLRAFNGDDAEDFFGREALIDELIQKLGLLLNSEQKGMPPCRLLALVGPSGLGKSSVVMAGLLPRLQAGGLPGSAEWVYLTPITPGNHPIETLAIALSEKLQSRRIEVIRDQLNEEDTPCNLHFLGLGLKKQPQAKVVLVVDQFEELFAQAVSEEERKHYIDLLHAAVSEPYGPVVVILTLRADFYDRPMNYPELGKLIDEHHCSILPMESDDLRSIIEKPALLPDVQLTFEGGLVGDLLFEMWRQERALPLLEFTLDKLFQLRQDHLLTLQAYREMGGIRGALVQHAEATYATLPTKEHFLLARELFLRLIDPGKTEQDASRRRAALAEFSHTDPLVNKRLQETIKVFTDAHLLTTNNIAGEPTIEVCHEALIWSWPRLTNWLRHHREDALLQQEISRDASEWEHKGKATERLYQGKQLQEAQVWASRNQPSITEEMFLSASVVECKRRENKERERLIWMKIWKNAAIIGALGILVVSLLVVQLLIAWEGSLNSLPVNVTNANDSGPGSLRDEIAHAQSGSAITFSKQLNGQTIQLTTGELIISKNLTISGPENGNVMIDAGGKSRVFHVLRDAVVSISHLTITYGSAFSISKDDDDKSKGNGGGIYNSENSSLALTDVVVTNNRANNGGGIYNQGYLTVAGSTVSHNSATHDGGGIANVHPQRLSRVIDSTVYNNTAQELGGGISNRSSALWLDRSTIGENQAKKGGGAINMDKGVTYPFYCTFYKNRATSDGGGLVNEDNTDTTIVNCIIAGNDAPVAPDVEGKFALSDNSVSLIQTTSGATIAAGKGRLMENTSPKFDGTLQKNRGPVMTYALLPGSPAIDRIPRGKWCGDDKENLTSWDERGLIRPQGATHMCDIGAYEYQPGR